MLTTFRSDYLAHPGSRYKVNDDVTDSSVIEKLFSKPNTEVCCNQGTDTDKVSSKLVQLSLQEPYSGAHSTLERLKNTGCRPSHNDYDPGTNCQEEDTLENTVLNLQNEVEKVKTYIEERHRGLDMSNRVYERIERDFYQENPAGLNHVYDDIYRLFSQRGFYHLRVLVDPVQNLCRKLIWLLIFVCSVAFLVYLVQNRIELYLRRETKTKVEEFNNDQLYFPAVTICNLNAYRLTSLASLGLYHLMTNLLQRDSPSLRTGRKYRLRGANMSYEQFLQHASHRRKDFIRECIWLSKPCSYLNFTSVYTDHGICYTFSSNEPVSVYGDVSAGLSVVLNVEQYEYLPGLRSAVGVIVSFHNRDDRPYLADGLYASVGHHTTVSLQQIQVNTKLPYSLYTQAWTHGSRLYAFAKGKKCLSRCELLNIIKRCNCLMPSNGDLLGDEFSDSYRPCTLNDYMMCVMQMKGSAFKAQCNCRQSPREMVYYDANIIESAVPSFVAEKYARSATDRSNIKQHFITGRDTLSRVDSNILNHDYKLFQGVLSKFYVALQGVDNISMNYAENFKRFNADSSLIKAVNTLNETVSKNSESFIKSTHIAFINFATKLRSELLRLVSPKNQEQTFNMHSRQDFKKRVTELMESLDKLIVTSSYVDNIIIENVKTGLHDMNREIVNGYGQKYREFRINRMYYNSTIYEVDGYLSVINSTLHKEYVILNRLRDETKVNRSSIAAGIHKFINVTDKLLHKPALKMIEKLDTMFTVYMSHTGSIKKLVKRLNSLGHTLSLVRKSVQNLLHNLQSSTIELKLKLADVYATLSTAHKDISSTNYLKSQTADKIMKEINKNTLSSIQNLVVNNEKRVEELNEQSKAIVTSIQSISSRIEDMTDIRRSELNSLYSTINHNVILNQYAKFKRSVDSALTSLSVLQQDLQEYRKSTDIDISFYRNNFLILDIYYKDFYVQRFSEQQKYSLVDMACNIGSCLALFLGVGVLSAVELLQCLCSAVNILLAHKHLRYKI